MGAIIVADTVRALVQPGEVFLGSCSKTGRVPRAQAASASTSGRSIIIETVVQFSDAPRRLSQMSMSGRANLPEDVFVDLRDDMNVRIAGLGDVVAHGVRENGCNFGRIQTVVNRKP